MPVDYASGSVHARLEILEKPGAKKTLYNVCFEATPSYACMPYAPAYTGTGVVEFSHPFSAFYQYKDVDWSKGVRQIALILKDENGTKMQGSPDFYPTRVRVTLTVVRPGAKYVPPAVGDASVPSDAATASDAASKPVPDPGPRDAGQDTASGDDASAAQSDAMPPRADAGRNMPDAAEPLPPSPDAASAPPMLAINDTGLVTAAEAGSLSEAAPDEAEQGGCATRHTPVHSREGWLLCMAALALSVNRARSRRP
jgi:hypothetical protein